MLSAKVMSLMRRRRNADFDDQSDGAKSATRKMRNTRRVCQASWGDKDDLEWPGITLLTFPGASALRQIQKSSV